MEAFTRRYPGSVEVSVGVAVTKEMGVLVANRLADVAISPSVAGDPAILLAPWEVIEERARDVLARGRTAEGHVFNLGHGVLPETDPSMLARLADLVHAESARTPG